jgi:hypothetical protein
MKYLAAALLVAGAVGTASAEAGQPCAADAIARARSLLTVHFNDNKAGEKPPENLSIEDRVRVLPPIRALKGKGRLDVLEVIGHIYRADYRMRFIYAQTKGCLLIGQEIIEISDPY